MKNIIPCKILSTNNCFLAEGLRDYFGRFGEVNECMVMRDPATKRARSAKISIFLVFYFIFQRIRVHNVRRSGERR